MQRDDNDTKWRQAFILNNKDNDPTSYLEIDITHIMEEFIDSNFFQ